MATWKINYNTGVGNETIEGTEEQAKAKADEGIVYTQQDVVIESEDGEKYIRRWYGCTASEEDECKDTVFTALLVEWFSAYV